MLYIIYFYSPNTPGLRSLQKKEELYQLLKKINEARNSINSNNKPPLLLKLAPDLTHDEMKEIVSVILQTESKVDGLIISNTTIERPQLQNIELSKETGGLSGRPLANKSTEMIKQMYKLTKGIHNILFSLKWTYSHNLFESWIFYLLYQFVSGKVPIIGVGGVFTGQDAYDKILAGASAVQIYTALIYHGPPVVTKIKNELAELLQRDGYKNVNEAVGKGVTK